MPRRRNASLAQRLLQRLTPRLEILRERLHPYSWSLAVHCLLLVVFFLIQLAASPPAPPLLLTISQGNDDTALTIIDLNGLPDAPTPQPVETDPVPSPSQHDEPKLSLAPLDSQPSQESQADAADGKSGGLSHQDAARAAEAARRVSARGGQIDAPIVVSLMWDGPNDIDLHMQYFEFKPNAKVHQIFFRNPVAPIAALDIDSNSTGEDWGPCENIVADPTLGQWQFTVAIHTFRVEDPRPIDYVVVVKAGKTKRVFTGKLHKKDNYKEIITFRYTAE